MLLIFEFVVLITVLKGSDCYHYNDYRYLTNWKDAPRYPDYCCPLEWTNMTQGQELPKDWILAGTFMNRDFAFSRSGRSDRLTAVKSSNPTDAPYFYGWSASNPFPILTNPNKCNLDWYTTKYYQEVPPMNESIFYPSTGYSQYGSYSQYENIPGWMYTSGEFAKMNSLTGYESITLSGVKQLYVDCLNSVPIMSTSKLVKLTFDQSKLDSMKESKSKEQIVKKEYSNFSPRDSNTSFKFSVTAHNSINMTLDESFSTIFNVSIKTYEQWLHGKRIKDFLSDARFNSGSHDHLKMWKTSNFDSKNMDIFGVYHQEKFEFGQEITIPSFSKVTVTAFSNPVVGRLPFEAVYELTPIKAGDNLINAKVLNATLTRYGKQKKIEITDRNTVLLTFDGTININSGNEVHLEIKSVAIDDKTESYGIPINTSDMNTTSTEH